MNRGHPLRDWKTIIGVSAIVVSVFVIGAIAYRPIPTESAHPRCADSDDAPRHLEFDHELNERFALAFAAYLMREGASVRFDKETSRVRIAPAHADHSLFVAASKNAAELLMYGTDPAKSILHANRGKQPEATCEQVKRLSAR